MYNSDFNPRYPVLPDLIPRGINFAALNRNDIISNEHVNSSFWQILYKMGGPDPNKFVVCAFGGNGEERCESRIQTIYCSHDGRTKILAGGRTFPVRLEDGDIVFDTKDTTQPTGSEEMHY